MKFWKFLKVVVNTNKFPDLLGMITGLAISQVILIVVQ